MDEGRPGLWQILRWMESAAFVAASRVGRGGRHLLTASMDSIAFRYPTRVGDILYVTAQVQHALPSTKWCPAAFNAPQCCTIPGAGIVSEVKFTVCSAHRHVSSQSSEHCKAVHIARPNNHGVSIVSGLHTLGCSLSLNIGPI